MRRASALSFTVRESYVRIRPRTRTEAYTSGCELRGDCWRNLTEKVGRVRTCKLGRRGLEDEAAWIERQRQLWAARFDELDKLVEELKQKKKANVRNKR